MSEKVILEDSKRYPERFGVLYKKYAPRIQAYLYRRLGSRELAEDLTQETFYRAFRYRSRFEDRGYSYSAFLFRIARNLLINHYRKRSTIPLDRVAEPAETPDLYSQRDAEYAWKAIGQLSPIEQNVLRLAYKNGWKIRDIARVVGKSENAVKLILSRARKKLRNHPYIRS